MHILRIIPISIFLASSTYGDPPKERAPAEYSPSEQVQFYLSRLKDKSYWEPYGDEAEAYSDGERKRWYIAAEELGRIGKPAIPHLIDRLTTSDNFEKTLVLYALRLASQTQEVRAFAGTDYIRTVGTFPYKDLATSEQIAMEWWKEYQHHWEAATDPQSLLPNPEKESSEQGGGG